MATKVFPLDVTEDDREVEQPKDESAKGKRPYKVFFRDLFLFKENELEAKKKEKFINRSMKVYEKSTFSSRMKSRSHLSQLTFRGETMGSFEKFGLDPSLVLRLAEGTDSKRSVYEFIKDQRDRFRLEYALCTKQNTIKKYEKSMALREKQLRKAEKRLENDAIAFEEFLRDNDQKSVDALKTAAQETINKLQMTAELKKATMEVQAIKSEIAKAEFLLTEYMKYGYFLLKLSPKQWQIQQASKRSQTNKTKDTIRLLLPRILKIISRRNESSSDDLRGSSISEESSKSRGATQIGKIAKKLMSAQQIKKSTPPKAPESISSEDSLEFFLDDDIEYDLEPEIYFREPEELLQVLTELEEQNLTLVQYSQDIDENLEDVNKRERIIQDKINGNIEFILEQKELLKASCVREEEKAAELELRSRLFSFGEFNSEAQEKLIDSLSKKINQVYKVCIGDAEVGSLTSVQKLVKVESRLVELSDLIDSIPRENVEVIERIKQKERRQKLREEKLKEKQKYQEERLRAALERAVALPKKKLGRRLIYRSKPPSANRTELLLVKDTRVRTMQDDYFFS
ncbi:coiled-coil domain-containing protein 38 [Suncus etruscus]|uniref:coiled-coil domain-containing protein 38 n=1 Tax=Suncus etruscus TaxID=109475 RepID=UPI0021105E70|nr:coiled-coil domain-containing protein 38 [Suncus etruscus]